MIARQKKGRGLFYHRDSGGKHENSPPEYVNWAQRKAAEIGVQFDGTPERIKSMIQSGTSRAGDLFLDYDVKGNLLTRKALDLLLHEATSDRTVSHIFIPRRDRLARPDNAVDGVQLELKFLCAGVALVFMDRTLEPIEIGQRQDIGQLIAAVLDYDKSGKDLSELAQKILHAQLALAKQGYSVGGRAPYAFRRWLARTGGTAVRQLLDGERVRMAGHHVVWMPGPDSEIQIALRIIEMIERMPACRVAAALTAEGVPTPDNGRTRTDGGVPHQTSGVWHASTVNAIARNKLFCALVSYGQRSSGGHLRFSPDGPRLLQAADFIEAGKPKVQRNAEDLVIVRPAPVAFAPVVDLERHQQLTTELNARGATQRGKPRSRTPDKNPLGSRIFDMNCSWPMYREPNGKAFRYKCGLYQQSHGAKCDHNHVDGMKTAGFLLQCIRQRVFSARVIEKIRARLLERARQEFAATSTAQPDSRQFELEKIVGELDQIGQNMALAKSAEQLAAISRVFDDRVNRKAILERELSSSARCSVPMVSPEELVESAISLLQKLESLVRVESNLADVGEAFRQMNVRIFFRFQKVREGKRELNKVTGGVVTFGSAPPPIEIYSGPTARPKIKGPEPVESSGPGDSSESPASSSNDSGKEGNSLGNVSRGDWIRTSDLLVPKQRRRFFPIAKTRENPGNICVSKILQFIL